MKPYIQFQYQGVQCYLWHVTQSLPQLLQMLSGTAIENIPCKAESKQKEYLIERILIQDILGRPVRLQHHPNGAPWLEGSQQHISISHTKDYVLIALSQQEHFGVDIERISSRVDKVLPHYVLPQEEKFYQHLSPAAATAVKVLLWSAKESIFKARVKGQVNTMLQAEILQMQSDHLPQQPWKQTGECQAISHPENHKHSIKYLLTEEYVLTISCQEGYLQTNRPMPSKTDCYPRHPL